VILEVMESTRHSFEIYRRYIEVVLEEKSKTVVTEKRLTFMSLSSAFLLKLVYYHITTLLEFSN
jgi:hypothetical protein